jgi:hypothetical protein
LNLARTTAEKAATASAPKKLIARERLEDEMI